MIAFRVGVVVIAFLAVWLYLMRMRSARSDRFVVLLFLGALVGMVVYPEASTWVANRLGIGRGVDLAFYLGFLLLAFVALLQRVRLREQERALTTLARELALLKTELSGQDAASKRRELQSVERPDSL